jgi:hypothetical protein
MELVSKTYFQRRLTVIFFTRVKPIQPFYTTIIFLIYFVQISLHLPFWQSYASFGGVY